ncbi:uncharacterized protein J8A68_005538 [[Candida] subhashii]|uniref:L-type lectin-like domain-containing protein n=1 Tax=[Candida] subhashii TaxID=561895 RepID=A0A8J5QES5_9ASCO|nr:uncharacterized protein J8A68_005538 [[Candida] subhashii]KAG7661018.1 hypothetical protein J8A68_005538 [[Candida] subhashii]
MPNVRSIPKSHPPPPNPQKSLPNLLDISSLSSIPKSLWTPQGAIYFDTGRLLIDNTGSGSIWSQSRLDKPEWTLEVVFRSTGTHEDIAFADENQFGIWIVSVDSKDDGERYDGFRILVNNHEKPGLKIFNNDGTANGGRELKDSIGECRFQYLSSQVPYTIRISYSEKRKWFKVQVNNNLCFKTDQIHIPNAMKYGISGDVNSKSNEKFEVLGIKVWDELIVDAIDDHGLIGADGDVRITEVIQQHAHASKPTASPGIVRESLMERARRQREQEQQNLLQKQQELYQQQQDRQQRLQNIQSQPPPNLDTTQLESKIQSLEQLITALSSTISTQEKLLKATTESFLSTQNDQSKQISNIANSLKTLEETFTKQSSQLLSAITALNEKVIGEVRQQHYVMGQLTQKVDLLMNNHQEIAQQYNRNQKEERERMRAPMVVQKGWMDTLTKWLLIPLVVVMLCLLVVVYRLRHDIKHSKLL